MRPSFAAGVYYSRQAIAHVMLPQNSVVTSSSETGQFHVSVLVCTAVRLSENIFEELRAEELPIQNKSFMLYRL
jgi:hypothetical protein